MFLPSWHSRHVNLQPGRKCGTLRVKGRDVVAGNIAAEDASAVVLMTEEPRRAKPGDAACLLACAIIMVGLTLAGILQQVQATRAPMAV
jgi:hypothetical protein